MQPDRKDIRNFVQKEIAKRLLNKTCISPTALTIRYCGFKYPVPTSWEYDAYQRYKEACFINENLDRKKEKRFFKDHLPLKVPLENYLQIEQKQEYWENVRECIKLILRRDLVSFIADLYGWDSVFFNISLKDKDNLLKSIKKGFSLVQEEEKDYCTEDMIQALSFLVKVYKRGT
jgi:hypothetical protein